MRFTRLLMSAAALVLGAVGIACLFAPALVLVSIAGDASPGSLLVAQVLGTLSLGFAVLDWMWKGNRIGGIYGRGIILANIPANVWAKATVRCGVKTEDMMY